MGNLAEKNNDGNMEQNDAKAPNLPKRKKKEHNFFSPPKEAIMTLTFSSKYVHIVHTLWCPYYTVNIIWPKKIHYIEELYAIQIQIHINPFERSEEREIATCFPADFECFGENC